MAVADEDTSPLSTLLLSKGTGLKGFRDKTMFNEDRLPSLDEINIDHPNNHGILGRPKEPLQNYDARRVVEHLQFEAENALAIIYAISRHANDSESFRHVSSQLDQDSIRYYYCIGIHTLTSHVLRCLRVLPYFSKCAEILPPVDIDARIYRVMELGEEACKRIDCHFYLFTQSNSSSNKNKKKGKPSIKRKTDSLETCMGASNHPFTIASLWYMMEQMQWQLDGLRAYNQDLTPKHIVLNDAIEYIRQREQTQKQPEKSKKKTGTTNQRRKGKQSSKHISKETIDMDNASAMYARIDELLQDINNAQPNALRLKEDKKEETVAATTAAAAAAAAAAGQTEKRNLTPEERAKEYSALDTQVKQTLIPELRDHCHVYTQCTCPKKKQHPSHQTAKSENGDDWWVAVCYALWCTEKSRTSDYDRRENLFEHALAQWM